jgi:hypothetical protein
MGAEIGDPFAILRCRTVPGAIVQDCFQRVIAWTRDVEVIVDDDPGDLLACASAHQPRFSGIHRKAFGFDNLPGDMQQRRRPLGKGLVTGKGDVIGVAGVIRAEAAGESGKALVETLGGEIGERG